VGLLSCMLTYIGFHSIVDILLTSLETHPVTADLPSRRPGQSLPDELWEFRTSNFDAESIIPLLKLVIGDAPDDDIWNEVFSLLDQKASKDFLIPGQDINLRIIDGVAERLGGRVSGGFSPCPTALPPDRRDYELPEESLCQSHTDHTK